MRLPNRAEHGKGRVSACKTSVDQGPMVPRSQLLPSNRDGCDTKPVSVMDNCNQNLAWNLQDLMTNRTEQVWSTTIARVSRQNNDDNI